MICPQCCHQFRAIPVDVQNLLLAAGFEPPFTGWPAARDSQAPAAPAAQVACVECGGSLQWRCPRCRIAQSAEVAAPAAPVDALRKALELSKYASAPFFGSRVRRVYPDGESENIYATTEDWWEGLRELIEAAQPMLEAALSRPQAEQEKPHE